MGFFLFLAVVAGVTAAAVGLSPSRRLKRELPAAPTLLRLSSSTRYQLVISDDPSTTRA